jgi:hypothetical protein
MPDRDPAAEARAEHGRAIDRLQAAVALQSRLRDEHQAAKDTPDEVPADASLRAADEQVVARVRWLESVDDHYY